MVIHTFGQSPPSKLHNATTSSTSLSTGFPTQAKSSAWTRLSQRKRPPVSSTISYHGCFKSATATAKSSARINLQPQQPVSKLTSTVPSAFAYHATINGSLLIPATTKCAQYSTSSSIRGQSQMQPSRLLASISTSGMRYGNHTLSLRMTSLSTANPSLVRNLMHVFRLVPSEFYNILFVAFHSNPMGGHFNVYHTLHRLRLCFYWPGMYKFISRMCNACPGCALSNPTRSRSSELLYNFPIKAPMKVIHINGYAAS